jgi:hypothetical protein
MDEKQRIMNRDLDAHRCEKKHKRWHFEGFHSSEPILKIWMIPDEFNINECTDHKNVTQSF